MVLINFDRIRSLLDDNSGSSNHQEVFEKVLLLVLARATRVDSNISPIEVDHVIEVLKETTGNDYDAADIRTAASSEVFESQSLERTLTKASTKITEQDRATILKTLADLIHIDTEVRYQELEFFDHVATALRASPSEVAGLVLKQK